MKNIMTCCIALMICLSGVAAFAQHKPVPATDEFTVTGAVKNELHISLKDLRYYKQDGPADRTAGKTTIKNVKGVLLTTILDSAHIDAGGHKGYSSLYILLTASDGYHNIYSWDELYNTEVGQHACIATEMDGKKADQMQDRILVMSFSDIDSKRRHLKGLAKIEVKKVQ